MGPKIFPPAASFLSFLPLSSEPTYKGGEFCDSRFNFGLIGVGPWGIGSTSLLGLILSAIFWLLAIIGILTLAKCLADSRKLKKGKSKPRDRALEILRERYAKGELSKKQFEKKKQKLAE